MAEILNGKVFGDEAIEIFRFRWTGVDKIGAPGGLIEKGSKAHSKDNAWLFSLFLLRFFAIPNL